MDAVDEGVFAPAPAETASVSEDLGDAPPALAPGLVQLLKAYKAAGRDEER